MNFILDVFRSPSKIIYGLLVGFVALLPLFFLPFLPVPFQVAKVVFIAAVALIALSLHIISFLKEGKIVLPRHIVWYLGTFAVCTYAVSSFFSPARDVSLRGTFFEVDTLLVLFLVAVIAYIASVYTKTPKQIYTLLLAGFAPILALVVFHIVRIIGFIFTGSQFLSFGLFATATANTVGKLNDVALCVGAFILALIFVYDYASSRNVKIFSAVSLALSLILVSAINFTLLWWVLAAGALVAFAYSFLHVRNEKNDKNYISYAALTVLLVSAIFIVDALGFDSATGSQPLSNTIARTTGISQVEARPSISGTALIAYQVFQGGVKNLLIGIGPNRFAQMWHLYKPAEINSTVFWNTDFSFGSGLLPTFAVTTGILGFLAWGVFFGFVLYFSCRFAFSRKAKKEKTLAVLLALLVAYSIFFFVFYVPSITTLALGFFYVGIMLAFMKNDDVVKEYAIHLNGGTVKNLAGVISIIIGLGFILVVALFTVQEAAASILYAKASQASTVPEAEQYLLRAISHTKSDVYYRSLSGVYINGINKLGEDSSLSKEALQAQFQTLLGGAVQTAQAAIQYDSSNYVNWISVGNVYEYVVLLKLSGAYDNAKAYYKESLLRNPKSPLVLFADARLEMTEGNNEAAKAGVESALTLKPDYVDALYLLSQIELNANNKPAAIEAVIKAASANPNDPAAFYQLGLLYYDAAEYQNAILVLERAVSLNPIYANAKYFLGLAYSKMGRVEDALTQLKGVKELNPDNAELNTIIQNLEAGKAPFPEVAPSKTSSKKKAGN